MEKDVRRRLRDIGDASICLDAPGAIERSEPVVARRSSAWAMAWILVGALLAAALLATWFLRSAPATATAPTGMAPQRLTDFVGMEESPAASPDGKTVAFVRTGANSQIWLRLLAGGGPPLQVTHDAADHKQPRWAPDSSTLIYFTPASTPGEQGTLWEVPALGGEQPRRLASAISGGEISHDGQYLAALQFRDERVELTTLTRDGARIVRTQSLGVDRPPTVGAVRWSPDDRWIALQLNYSLGFNEVILGRAHERR